MRLPEFIEAAESYGVKVSRRIKSYGQVSGKFWESILGPMPPIGRGYRRIYTPLMVRRLVAWNLIGETTGTGGSGNQYSDSPSAPMRRQATRLLAAASEGWVVMSEGRAFWSLVPPVTALKKGAVAIPVPRWRH